MTQVIMPKMGDGMEEGTLLEWLKKEGDKVKSGEPIATIQTDKASLEMEAPGDGVLAGILTKVGDSVPVGKPMAVLLKDGEALPTDWGYSDGAAAQGEAKAVIAATPQANSGAQPDAAVSIEATPSAQSTRIKASPLAKKVAKERGIDLTAIAGSGPGGRIIERDVKAVAIPSSAPPAVSAADRLVPINKIRQITAKRTTESKQTVPHFYVTVEVDLESVNEVRNLFAADGDFKPSINDFVLRACALALRDMPVVNSTFQGDAILEHGAINIGMAVALEDGLTVPVLHNVDRLTLREISALARDLAMKARDNRLGMDELSGSTFSVSNMGMLGVQDFAAIINVPNAAIVAVASARKVVVPTEDGEELEVRTKMNLTGSFDHRVVDGAVGARFMNLVREYLEKPTRLLT